MKRAYNPHKTRKIISNTYVAEVLGVTRQTILNWSKEYGKYDPYNVHSLIAFLMWIADNKDVRVLEEQVYG